MVWDFDLAILRHIKVTGLLRLTNDAQIFLLVVFSQQLADRCSFFYDLREFSRDFFACGFARARGWRRPFMGELRGRRGGSYKITSWSLEKKK
jgi:hypothetical protein